MSASDLHAKLADAMRLLQMLERFLDSDSETDRLWYGDMLKDELSEFRDRYPERGQQ